MTDTRKSLAELRESVHTGPLQLSQDVCVAGPLFAEYDELDTQFREAYNEAPAERSNVRQADGKPRHRQIAERMEEVRAEMARHVVTVRVHRIERHEWKEWADAHPPRVVEDRHQPGCDRDDCDGCLVHRDDAAVGVNLDALVDDLERHVATINGEKPQPGDWAFVQTNGSDGDMLELARKVAASHVVAVSIPKSRLDWLNAQTRDDDSKPRGRGA